MRIPTIPYSLAAKIHSEGYCCINGYLRLCQARNESVPAMARFIEISPDTLWYHYRQLEQGKNKCMNWSTCLTPIITELEAIKKAPKKEPLWGDALSTSDAPSSRDNTKPQDPTKAR